MTPTDRKFAARLLTASSIALILFGWGFLQAGTGMALLLIGILCLGAGIVFDRSSGTLILAIVASAALIAVPLLLFRSY
jgi:hypothetical protein